MFIEMTAMRSTLAFLAAAVLYASAPAYADDQSRLQTAHEVVELTHSDRTMQALLPIIEKQLRPLLLQQSGNNAKLVDTFTAKMDQRFTQSIGGFLDLVAQVYAREFSDDDLNALATFYKSPAGQHLIDKQVVMASGMMAVGQQWGAKMAQDILQEFKQQQTNPASKL